jgi:hypothetical protein
MASKLVVLTLLLGAVGAVKMNQDDARLRRHKKDSAADEPAASGIPGIPPTWRAAPPTPPPPDAWSYVSNDLRQCVEGTPEMVESALALRKAGLTGTLYNNTFAVEGGCEARGYKPSEGSVMYMEGCHPNVTAYYLTGADAAIFAQALDGAINEYAKRWGLDPATAHKMLGCTCHPSSLVMDLVAMECPDVLSGMSGAWVHHDPKDGSELMCDAGPFLEATRALAIIKSTGQLMMHEHDQIAPVTCAELGWSKKYPIIDHCFKGLHMYYMMEPIGEDPGIKKSGEVEQAVFSSGFSRFVLDHHLNNKVLNGRPGCHCSPDSEAAKSIAGSKKNYDAACLHNTSPIRLWWTQG